VRDSGGFHQRSALSSGKRTAIMITLRAAAYASRSAMGPHYHAEMSFSVIVRGRYVERIGGSEVEHGPGHMLLYPAEETHSQRFGQGGVRQVIFTPDDVTLDALRECGVSAERPRYARGDGIARLGPRLWSEVECDDGFGRFAAEGLALELLALFGRRKRQAGAAGAPPPAWLVRVRELVSDAEGESLTLSAVAAQVGRHPVHVAREFRRHFGGSIGDHRRAVRLRRAEQLLRTKLGLSEIALACGFSSHSHFSRAFAAAYGVTPSRYRVRG
jgi:AraC family transcriptional regulator